MTDYRDKDGVLFWSDHAARQSVKAIEFATSANLRDDHERVEFLMAWMEGDIRDYPEFFTFLDEGKRS